MTPALTHFYAYWCEWFAQPEEECLKRLVVHGKGGYYPIKSEEPGYTGEKDPKRYFHWKLSHWDDDRFGGEVTRNVFHDCYFTAQRWLAARGLHNIAAMDERNCVLRILHYPPHPTGAVGQAHRDFDLLTVSVEGTAPGLEVCRRVAVEPYGHGIERWISQEAGVQVGEMLEIYTVARAQCYDFCDSLRATTHRVRTAPNTDRLKAVFFYLPPMDFELRPGFTAKDYLFGPNGVLVKAGTSKAVP